MPPSRNSMASLPLLLPDGPLTCCGQPAIYVHGIKGSLPRSLMVVFQCTVCQKTLGDLVPAGPAVPRGALCWSCGAARDRTGCTDCGLAAADLDALAAYVRNAVDPASDARGLLERGYYRTGLAILHASAALRPDDVAVGALRDPLLRAFD